MKYFSDYLQVGLSPDPGSPGHDEERLDTHKHKIQCLQLLLEILTGETYGTLPLELKTKVGMET